MTRKCVSGWLMLAATILAAGPALALEPLPGEPEIVDKSEAAHDEALPLSEPLASGRVVAVDQRGAQDHLEIRPTRRSCRKAASGVFDVGKPASLEGLSPGDKVRFEVERAGRPTPSRRIEHSN